MRVETNTTHPPSAPILPQYWTLVLCGVDLALEAVVEAIKTSAPRSESHSCTALDKENDFLFCFCKIFERAGRLGSSGG